MKTFDIRLNCPACKSAKNREDFYWNKLGQKVYVECKECITDILKDRREEKKIEKLFYY